MSDGVVAGLIVQNEVCLPVLIHGREKWINPRVEFEDAWRRKDLNTLSLMRNDEEK